MSAVLDMPATADSACLGKRGPWGRLELAPILISAPAEFVKQYHFETTPQPWRFPHLSRQQTEALLWRIGMMPQTIAHLMSASYDDAAIAGTCISPDPETLRTLPAAARSKLYQWLAQADSHSLAAESFRYCGDSVDEWLYGAPLRDATIELVRPYVYRQGAFLRFADLPAIVPQLPDEAELHRLVQALARESTMLVKLHVGPGDDIDQLVEYWGRGWRIKDIRPILESLRHFRRSHLIDIVHLLPPFARRFLFTYPNPVLDGKDDFRNCYWTALNFFNETPDDRLLEPAIRDGMFQRDWHAISGPPLLGDVAMFHDDRDIAYHAAVYVADDVLFSKNGSGMARPWLLIHAEHLQDLYWRGSPLHVRYYRRNDLA